jgi:hypothetical protein
LSLLLVLPSSFNMGRGDPRLLLSPTAAIASSMLKVVSPLKPYRISLKHLLVLPSYLLASRIHSKGGINVDGYVFKAGGGGGKSALRKRNMQASGDLSDGCKPARFSFSRKILRDVELKTPLFEQQRKDLERSDATCQNLTKRLDEVYHLLFPSLITMKHVMSHPTTNFLLTAG